MRNMKNRNENTPLFQYNSPNAISSDNKGLLISEFKSMKHDLLFFKNDILSEIRKIEEKFNAKISEYNLNAQQHYDFYDKKIDLLSTQISLTNSKLIDNTDLIEKLNSFQPFKSKTEDQILSLNTRMNSIQKEYKDYFTNFEKLIEDNLKYPGTIGKNAKFKNFRFFIDYMLKYSKEYDEFREEVKSWDIFSFKRSINSNLQQFRYAIDDSYRNSLTLIEKNNRQYDKKLEDAIEKTKTTMEEHEENLQELKDKTIEYLEEYKTKFEDLEKDLNEKYQEQLNEIDNLKKLKNQIIAEVKNIKMNNETNTIINGSKNESPKNKYIMKIINNNYISDEQQKLNENNIDKNAEREILEKNKELVFSLNINNIKENNNKTYIIPKGRNNDIMRQILLNNNNDKIDSSIERNNKNINNIQNNEEIINRNNNIDIIVNKIMNKTQKFGQSKSFERIFNTLDIKNNENNNLLNSKEHFSFTQDEMMMQKERSDILNAESLKFDEKNIFNKFMNSPKKDILKSNYSISNIPNIKIKTIVLPEFLTNRNANIILPNSSISENKRYRIVSDKYRSSSKSFTIEEINRSKAKFDLTKINKRSNEKIKGSKLEESPKIINKELEHKISENDKSLIIKKIKHKNNPRNSFGDLNMAKTRNLLFENKKNEKDQATQNIFRKTYYEKNQPQGVVLINPKNLTKNRKIQFQ